MASTESVEQTVKDIIVGIVHCSPDDLKPDATWKDMEADSLDLVQVLVALEDKYGIEISDEDAEKFTNFGDMVKYIEERVAG
jgi:acyl carrier protein